MELINSDTYDKIKSLIFPFEDTTDLQQPITPFPGLLFR